jgi:ABC-2 type transport system permease protein
MISYLIKALSFFIKEFHDIRRQPRLLLSLVGGPMLVLGAFGATFRSSMPYISTVLVWPENGVPGVNREQAIEFIGSKFRLVDVTSDEEAAMAMLEAGQVDAVQIIPDGNFAPGDQQRPEIRVFSRSIDPTAEAWIRSMAYGELNFVNQQLLAQEAVQAKGKAQEIDGSLAGYQADFEELRADIQNLEIERTRRELREMRELLQELVIFLPPASLAQANVSPELSDVYRDINLLQDDLNEMEDALDASETALRSERLDSAIDEIKQLRSTIGVFVDLPAENIISPVRETYTNLRGSTYSLVIFYAPSVLALLIQQLAVTLASLGLVRERQMGSFEMFRVSPLVFSQILLGKSLAYILYVSFAGILLTLLMTLLGVPLPAALGQFLVMLVLLATASVGIGSLISATSRTDGQAIQNTMLVLLLSIFFTGFFLPISGFAWPAWIISLLLPMTYAVRGFRDLMLAGGDPLSVVWIGLVAISLLSYGLVALIMRRRYRQVLD